MKLKRISISWEDDEGKKHMIAGGSYYGDPPSGRIGTIALWKPYPLEEKVSKFYNAGTATAEEVEEALAVVRAFVVRQNEKILKH